MQLITDYLPDGEVADVQMVLAGNRNIFNFKST